MRPIDADKIEYYDDEQGFEIAYKVDIDTLPTLTPPNEPLTQADLDAMDYDKLIERLIEHDGIWCSVETGYKLVSDATLAIATLRAENERLNTLANLGNTRSKDYRIMRDRAIKAEADLARVTAERDAAEKEITRLKAIMREKGVFTIPAKYPWEKPEWNWKED